MNRTIKHIIIYALFVTALLVVHCGGDKIAGAGSETTNGVVMIGRLENNDGSPARAAIVKLLGEDYDAAVDGGLNASFIDTTDSAGAFRFCNVDSGRYNVLARNKNAGTGALKLGIQVEKDDSVVTVPPCSLEKTGSIAVDLTGGADTTFAYLFIPGTDIFAYVDTNRLVTLGDVPAGVIPVVSCAKKTGGVHGVRYDVNVPPEDTLIIRNPAWRYNREIAFNTSSSGAGVGRDVYNFPVLIRLNGSNFNFREAQSGGRDIRFAKGDNTFAAFEIEAWDSLGAHAEIWVRIDTLFGNSAAQTITMYWGNPQAEAASDAGAVFDTAAGFQGVWHFNETLVDSAHDATVNHYNGAAEGMGAASIIQGVIGNCREYDGISSCIIMPNTANGKLDFPQDGNYTVSAWVSADSLDSGSHVVLSKGGFQYYLWFTYIYQNSPNWEFVEYEENVGWKCPAHPVVAKQWVLLTGVCDGKSQYLYVNGELADTAIITYANAEPRNTTTDFIIGRYITKAGYPPGKLGGYCYFDGKIDEVRASSRSRSAEWIRLCSMNQGTDDKLVRFK